MLSGLLYSNIAIWNIVSPETWRSSFHFSPSSSTCSFHSLWLHLLNISWMVPLLCMPMPSADYHPPLLQHWISPIKRDYLKCKHGYGLCWPPKTLPWISIVPRMKFKLNLACKSVQALTPACLSAFSYKTLCSHLLRFVSVSPGCQVASWLCFFTCCSFT